jgi:hypothetical protein
MLGSTTISTKTLKLIVPKNFTSIATPSTPKTLKSKVFSILPKNTKKEEKNHKIQKNILPLMTPITINKKVFFNTTNQ